MAEWSLEPEDICWERCPESGYRKVVLGWEVILCPEHQANVPPPGQWPWEKVNRTSLHLYRAPAYA